MSCSDSGSDDMPLGANGDLASRTLVLESKRFYLDVKENKRGRFIKIAEISADGRKGDNDSDILKLINRPRSPGEVQQGLGYFAIFCVLGFDF